MQPRHLMNLLTAGGSTEPEYLREKSNVDNQSIGRTLVFFKHFCDQKRQVLCPQLVCNRGLVIVNIGVLFHKKCNYLLCKWLLLNSYQLANNLSAKPTSKVHHVNQKGTEA